MVVATAIEAAAAVGRDWKSGRDDRGGTLEELLAHVGRFERTFDIDIRRRGSGTLDWFSTAADQSIAASTALRFGAAAAAAALESLLFWVGVPDF